MDVRVFMMVQIIIAVMLMIVALLTVMGVASPWWMVPIVVGEIAFFVWWSKGRRPKNLK